MLYTLFSPSESKNIGGNKPPLSELLLGLSSRQHILNTYQNIVLNGSDDTLSKLTGIKKVQMYQRYRNDLYLSPTEYAIERYSGVAYEYLNTSSLDSLSIDYLKKQTIIFSNLFGPILGGDTIPDYKVKQGESIGDIAPERYYKSAFTEALNSLLNTQEVLDLRAGYYDKFYRVSHSFTTLKFLKNGKVVSHWAKAYRGIILRQLALYKIDTLDDFMKLEIEGLLVKEIKKIKNKTEIIFDIV